ncbi:MAG: deoxyhypusine synthase [candidate division WOR-3 bacterium]
MKKKNYRYRPDLSELPDWLRKRRTPRKHLYLSGKRILPEGITGKESAVYLIEETFLAYNSARLRQACQLFVQKMLKPKTIIGMSLAGALTPAGLGCSCIVPLIKAGFIDWIVATGANMYHDLHFAFNFPLYAGSPAVDDADLRKNDVVRIYDIFLGYTDCLCATDEILRKILLQPEFQKEMGTAEFYHYLGKYAAEYEEENGLKDVSILAAAYRYGVPVHTSSPGDSTIGMNIAGLELKGLKLRINPSIDVNETTSYVLYAKRSGGESGVVLVGGGSPKNFMLQTEPQIQEILMLRDVGQDYFIQFTDARPDTGGLSGATPHEAVSWGKVDPNRLPDAIVCYLDATVALPLFTHYALARHKPRKLHRLYDRRVEMMERLKQEFFQHTRI